VCRNINRPDAEQVVEGGVDGARRGHPQPGGEGAAGRERLPALLVGVAAEDGVQADRLRAYVGVEDPLGHDGEIPVGQDFVAHDARPLCSWAM
jgi:hypothetical protein